MHVILCLERDIPTCLPGDFAISGTPATSRRMMHQQDVEAAEPTMGIAAHVSAAVVAADGSGRLHSELGAPPADQATDGPFHRPELLPRH